MPLNIDTSQALRTPSHLRALVEAVRDAPIGTQERQSIEWKREGDAETKRIQVKLARAILGFANRDPDAAATDFEGCAYALLGVEPGKVAGAPQYDASEVESWLEQYVGKGSDGPGWSPDFTRVDDKWVLVITVEPPRHGHRIWTLRKSFTQGEAEEKVPLREGTIFVRRGTRTLPANAEEVEALARRACSTRKRVSGLSVLVVPGSMAVPIDTSDAAVKVWAQRRRDALRPDPMASNPSVVDPESLKGIAKTAALFASKMYDQRTHEQFDAEVEKYIAQGKVALRPTLQRAAVYLGHGRVELLLRNNTDQPLRDVEVVLSIEAPNVDAYTDSGDVEGPMMPRPPEPFGHVKDYSYLSKPLLDFRTPYSFGNVPSLGPRVRIQNGGSSVLEFPGIDVRPRKTERLDEFYLLVAPEHAGRPVEATWTAAATDADGRQGDSVAIPVMSPPMDMTMLLDSDLVDLNWGDRT